MSYIHQTGTKRYNSICVDSAKIYNDITVKGDIHLAGQIINDTGINFESITFKDNGIGSTDNTIEMRGHVTFSGPVTFRDQVKGLFDSEVNCDACLANKPGFDFDEHHSVCLHCIRDVAIQFRAKESWAETNGDPYNSLLKRVASLEAALEEVIKQKTDK